jgi:hypothetical protein
LRSTVFLLIGKVNVENLHMPVSEVVPKLYRELAENMNVHPAS